MNDFHIHICTTCSLHSSNSLQLLLFFYVKFSIFLNFLIHKVALNVIYFDKHLFISSIEWREITNTSLFYNDKTRD